MYASVIEESCLVALEMVSYTELATSMTDFAAATADSDPAGADLAAASSATDTFLLNSATCSSSSALISCFVPVATS